MLGHNPTRMDSYNKTQPNSQGTLLANWYQQRIHRQKKGNGRAITRIHQPKNHQNLMQNTDGFKNNKRDDTKYRVIGDYNYNIGTSQNYQQIIYLFSYGKSSNKADSMNRIGKRQQMTQQMRKSNYQTTNKTTYVPKSFQNNKIGRLIMINQSGNQVPIQNFDFDLRQQNNFIQRGQITSDQQLRKIVDIDHGYQRAQPVTYWRQKMQDGNYYMSNPGKTQGFGKNNQFLKTFKNYKHNYD